jgi:hypothetical protein
MTPLQNLISIIKKNQEEKREKFISYPFGEIIQ